MKLVDCPRCNGVGGYSYAGISGPSPDGKALHGCYFCNGTGKVTVVAAKEQIDFYNATRFSREPKWEYPDNYEV